MRNLTKHAGSYQKIGIFKQDVNNYVKKIKREGLEYGNAEFVLTYLKGKKNVDPSFFVRYTKDED